MMTSEEFKRRYDDLVHNQSSIGAELEDVVSALRMSYLGTTPRDPAGMRLGDQVDVIILDGVRLHRSADNVEQDIQQLVGRDRSPVFVPPHTRKDGSVVRGYARKRTTRRKR